jgi:hypothetical protein
MAEKSKTSDPGFEKKRKSDHIGEEEQKKHKNFAPKLKKQLQTTSANELLPYMKECGLITISADANIMEALKVC